MFYQTIFLTSYIKTKTIFRSAFGGGVDKLFPDDCGRNVAYFLDVKS